jgi:hypothetical protein
MTKDILNLTGTALSKALGVVLEPGEHIWSETQSILCIRCRHFKDSAPGVCRKPIPLTPAEAFKWRDWAVEKVGIKHYCYQLEQIYRATLALASDWSQYGFGLWLLKAKPHHYLQAAALCVIKENK